VPTVAEWHRKQKRRIYVLGLSVSAKNGLHTRGHITICTLCNPVPSSLQGYHLWSRYYSSVCAGVTAAPCLINIDGKAGKHFTLAGTSLGSCAHVPACIDMADNSALKLDVKDGILRQCLNTSAPYSACRLGASAYHRADDTLRESE
jgi:hypothetical protein